MKTTGFDMFAASSKSGNLFHQRIFVLSLIIALIFAFFPVAGVFAAPANDPIKNLELAWSNKLVRLHGEAVFYNNFQMQPETSMSPSKWEKAQTYLNKYRSAMSRAQIIAARHDGFNSKGHVTHENRAKKSLQTLSAQLQILRAMRLKLGSL